MKSQIVYIKSTNSIGSIIDQGQDPNGATWYRTDMDGIRSREELIFLNPKIRTSNRKPTL